MKWQLLWQNLRRAVDAERHCGYTDGGVIGGFSAFARSALAALRREAVNAPGPWGARLTLWEGQLQHYQRQPVAERRLLVEQISQNLAVLEMELSAHLPVAQPLATEQVLAAPGTALPGSRTSVTEPSETRQRSRAPSKTASPDAPSMAPERSFSRGGQGPGTEIQFLRGVGPQRATTLKKLGIATVRDLIFHLPHRYIDRSQLMSIAQIRYPGDVTVAGVIRAYQQWTPRRGLSVIKGQIDDGSGLLPIVLFNRKHLPAKYPPGTAVVVSGKAEFRYGKAELHVEEMENQAEAGLHTNRIVPVYPATEGLNQRFLRGLFEQVLDRYAPSLIDPLPPPVTAKLKLPGLVEAVRHLHFPESLEAAEAGRRKIAFNEIFLLSTAWRYVRRQKQGPLQGIRHQPTGEELARFWSLLPYELTGAQKRVIAEIEADMEAERPMHRLLQGDVGAGKTVVAASAVVKAVASGYQAALMAPTEVLADQHAINWQSLLANMAMPVAHLTGSIGRRRREEILRGLADGSIPVVVGTHALLQKEVAFRRLGLVIIDEQHRFGVRQRAILKGKSEAADLLVMTATPIPRTLAMTVYGDLDVSILDERPPGRRQVKTHHVGADAWPRIYRLIRREVAAGRQAYVVCPAIEDSEESDLAAVEERFATLSRDVFPDLEVGILHGRLKKDDKAAVMERFYRGQLHILVATTVIEVGVDVPAATVMVIEGAERFGLAQLHQLRGRVGRGDAQSYCILVADKLSEEGRQRMQAMEASDDGFRLAEEDLKLRGPGEFLGTRQSGIPAFKAADLVRDAELIESAKEWARRWSAHDPELQLPESRELAQRVRETFHGLDLF
ncbi:ATP-dependent DNA helicase RecG [Heliobacterium gestii]|uniref:ATP-dependent DNA helicase RecG n=1 Tax=Heliomicrobium gestii TaxID=2699 RepID=A0A845LBL6_HELGE|nr:ATP-dependent DNA helicase RecG [Heliomicrobium gestii]MBM7867027.1 ATP-dependent DNA helicase RecG [Heliomicrobium gestii]MZP43558.1 ATP-dependent DNA helicase RecG [Heliomicrobium gestii]